LCAPRLLIASWQTVKPSLKDVTRVLAKSQPALAPELAAIQALGQKLDEAVSSGCGPPQDAWQLYRRILGFFSHYGSIEG
jgi:hypothetical protein